MEQGLCKVKSLLKKTKYSNENKVYFNLLLLEFFSLSFISIVIVGKKFNFRCIILIVGLLAKSSQSKRLYNSRMLLSIAT
jgi:hypothetical protein